MLAMRSNNTFERTVGHRAACRGNSRSLTLRLSWSAAQLGR